ncbi:hypothetical protein [Pseudaminobacter soli (ex Li et al. 2025)]|nr:hypothetical protein [Mesorhizobium soli]
MVDMAGLATSTLAAFALLGRIVGQAEGGRSQTWVKLTGSATEAKTCPSD